MENQLRERIAELENVVQKQDCVIRFLKRRLMIDLEIIKGYYMKLDASSTDQQSTPEETPES